MKRSVQTLFLLLVLILSFSFVSCDEKETMTTTEPSERRTLATVPSFPSFTVEIPVNPIAFEKAYALQYDFLREKIAELEEIAFTDGDFVALEEKIEALTKNVTDSEQEIILLYGSKTLEALRETKNPTFYYNSLGLELCALASKAKSNSLPTVQAIIQDCMLQVQPGWWSDLPYFALSIRQTQETESQ
ncbi:MAG: hypothetical protein IKD18_02770, partial [Clostridia bacterium]|nr:hypothetical protein [Clostridia bacterium]